MKVRTLILLAVLFSVGCQGMLSPQEIKNTTYGAHITMMVQAEELRELNSQDTNVIKAIDALELATKALQPTVDWFRGKKPGESDE